MRTTSRSIQPPSISEAQARESLGLYIQAHLAIKSVQATAEQAIDLLKKNSKKDIETLQIQKDTHETILMHYAEARPELFAEARKVEIYGGHKIGWQCSPWGTSLAKLGKGKVKQTWEGALKAIRGVADLAKRFIRQKEEINKEAILEYHREAREVAAKNNNPLHLIQVEQELKNLGLEVSQEESFVIDLNIDEPEKPKKSRGVKAA